MSLQGSNSSLDSEQMRPLLLDLLDADGRHVTEAVIGVSWADAQGAFLVAAATASSLHIFTIRRQCLLPQCSSQDSNLIAEQEGTLTSIVSRLPQAAYLLKFSNKQAKTVNCLTGVPLQTSA